MIGFDTVLHGSTVDSATGIESTALGPGAMPLAIFDEADLPEPLSSLEHVARSTAGRQSLIPAKPLWPFGPRARPHRQTG